MAGTITGTVLLDGRTDVVLNDTIKGAIFEGPGTLATTGTVTVVNGATLTSGAVWTNQGTVDVTSGRVGVGPLNNQTHAVLNLTADSNPFVPGVTLTNAGTIETGGTGITDMQASIVDTGTIDISSGTLDLTTNFVNDGTAVIASGSRLDVSSAVDPSSSGVFLLESKGSLEIAAALGSGIKIHSSAVLLVTSLLLITLQISELMWAPHPMPVRCWRISSPAM